MSWSFDYTPNRKEVTAGMSLACRPAFSGGWRVFLTAYGLLVGASYALAGVVVAYVLLSAFGVDPFFDMLVLYWLISMALAGGMMWAGRLSRRRMAQAYLDSPVLRGQRVSLSEAGIGFDNSRSSSLTAWADVISIEEDKQIVVATLGSTGLILPDRLLAQVGDAAAIREQIKAWHAQAQAAT